MRIVGVELKSNEAVVSLISYAEGLVDLPPFRARRVTMSKGTDAQTLKDFQFEFSKLMKDYQVEKVVIRERPTKGRFAGSAVGFKMEAAIQLIEGLNVELLSANQIKTSLKHTPLPIEFAATGLKGFQEGAFTSAFASCHLKTED
ncbi:DUF3010 family protein [Paraferrimonas sedimenticola]|uniref:DUF3010 family protein n=1 Tax=Paraferrimonas sedimenticola TaxID=375674 RepID=A0AA37RUI1_9GAMM|nr:DUF3010 family protein [Paraferrimonas sedimenticola]GLP95566.1 hypothetical protein GCM10007895_08720 [Paraferrimonas sedimenticola]